MIGQIISHYKILEKLGEGGMGIVYKAKDIHLDRFAALKFFPLHFVSDEELKNRFIREAKITSSLDHPNICTIYEINEYQNSQLFISMAFYEGDTLKKKLENGILDDVEVIDYAIQIAQGLRKAHEKKIIHRDIKPANIIVTSEGLVKILDFGIAKLLQTSRVTKEMPVIGTAAYMSPEQIKGDEVDQRTDIFSFGVTLYEMLTGFHPFKGEYDQAIIYSILNEIPKSINEINPDVFPELNSLVFRCLSKEKSERYNSCEEIIDELNSLKLSISQSRQNKNDDNESDFIKNFIPQKTSLFVGREQQIKSLQENVSSILLGEGKTVFICGEPGIGKTQLIFNTIKDFTDSDVHILYGRCLYNEGGLPYHPFVSAVKNSTAYKDEQFFNKLVKIAFSNGISITNKIPLIKLFINFSGDYSNTLFHKEQLWDAVFVLFCTIARDKPLIIVLDDIQWADKATLELISFIARNIANLPVLLIGVFRPYEPMSDYDNSTLIETIRSLRIENLAEKIELERFSEKETHKIITELLNCQKVDKRISNKVFRQSEGNPLFINELVSLMKDKGYIIYNNNIWQIAEEDEIRPVSERVQDVIRQRIDQLDSKSREILEFASCEGEYFQSDVLAGCLNINRIELLKKLQKLENDYRIIRYQKSFYRFDHILIRDVLYESILPELRVEYHRIISIWLVENYGNRDEYASRISYHLISAGEEEKSINYLLTAAIRERDLYAVEEALNHYKKLYRIISNVGADDNYKLLIEEGLGDTYSSVGKTGEALKHYEHYLDLARSNNKQPDIVYGLHKLSECYRTIGDINKAEELCNEAIDLANRIDDKKKMLDSLNTLAFINASRGDYNKTIEISNNALILGSEINDLKNKSISLSNLGFAFWHLGNYPLAMEKFTDALSIQSTIGDKRGLSTSLNYLGLVYWKLGKYERALSSTFESVNLKKSISDFRTIPGSLNGIGDIFRDIGDLDKAVGYHSQSLILAREYNNKGAICDNLRDLGEDYYLLGKYDESLNYYLEVLDLATTLNIKWYEARSCISLSEYYLKHGKIDEAKKHLIRGFEISYRLNAKDLIIEALWKQALIKAEENLMDDSIDRIERAIDLAAAISHNTFLWKLYLDYSKISIHFGNNEAARKAIDQAQKIVKKTIEEFTDEKLKITYVNTPKILDVYSLYNNYFP